MIFVSLPVAKSGFCEVLIISGQDLFFHHGKKQKNQDWNRWVGQLRGIAASGIEYYSQPDKQEDPVGLLHYDLGGYLPGDIEIAAAFDIDRRKVGRPIHEAIHAQPNCVYPIERSVKERNVTVKMGHILDGVSDHMKEYPEHRTFLPSDEAPVDVAEELSNNRVEILLSKYPGPEGPALG